MKCILSTKNYVIICRNNRKFRLDIDIYLMMLYNMANKISHEGVASALPRSKSTY